MNYRPGENGPSKHQYLQPPNCKQISSSSTEPEIWDSVRFHLATLGQQKQAKKDIKNHQKSQADASLPRAINSNLAAKQRCVDAVAIVLLFMLKLK